MDIYELFEKRYSCRNYDKNKKVEEKTIKCILNQAKKAPSAVNNQPWEFLVVQKDENLKKVKKLYNRDWFNDCTTAVLIISDKESAWTRKMDVKNHADIDCAIVTTYLMLAAKNEGVDTCWIGNFDTNMASQIFDFSDGKEIMAIIAMGYSKDEKIKDKERKKLDEIVKFI